MKLTWTAPTRSSKSQLAEDRPYTYRVWKSLGGADSWTELTSAFRITGTSVTDPLVKAGYLYDYVVQVWEPGTGMQRGAQTKVSIAAAATQRLSNPVAPPVMITTRASTVYGYLYPKRWGRTAVRIYKYRQVGKVYKSYGFVNAYTSNIAGDNTKSKYSAAVKLPYRGRWRLRSYFPGTGMWSSGYDYVTVK